MFVKRGRRLGFSRLGFRLVTLRLQAATAFKQISQRLGCCSKLNLLSDASQWAWRETGGGP